MNSFSDFDLQSEVVARLSARGINEPTPIQAESLPHSLQGKDVIGRARTGTGKTLAFALPIIEGVVPSRERGRAPRALILAPTRELAKQIAEEFKQSAPALNVLAIYGGTSYSTQERGMHAGVDVVVGTPGRIIDHLDRRNLDLTQVQFAVLDEADEMLNVGFADAVEQILSTVPEDRQTMLFSATLTDSVKHLARKYMRTPVIVDLIGEKSPRTAQTVRHMAIAVGKNRTRVLADLISVYNPERTIVFTRTKREADELALELISRGLEAEGLHGDLAQAQRERALAAFRSGRTRVLVATDVAARGLDIPEVDIVVQYHMPQDTESYIHRSGRTGRAGRSGMAFVMYGSRENHALKNLERTIGTRFEQVQPPSTQEVQNANLQNAGNMIRNVEDAVAEVFMGEAEKLIAEMGVVALAKALARISGITEAPKPQSLLSGEDGFVTVSLMAQRMSIPRAVALIARGLNMESRELGKIRLFEGGAVADVPTDKLQALLELSPLDDKVPVVITDQLPPLLDSPARTDSRSGDRGSFRSRDGGTGSNGGSWRDRDNRGRSDSRSGGSGEFRSNDRRPPRKPVTR